MGPRWGQRIRRADPTRLIADCASGLTSTNTFDATASPPEKRKVGGSIPPLATTLFIEVKALKCGLGGASIPREIAEMGPKWGGLSRFRSTAIPWPRASTPKAATGSPTSIPAEASTGRAHSVSIGPGATAFTRIPSGARERARFFVRDTSAFRRGIAHESGRLVLHRHRLHVDDPRPIGRAQQGQGDSHAADGGRQSLVEGIGPVGVA